MASPQKVPVPTKLRNTLLTLLIFVGIASQSAAQSPPMPSRDYSDAPARAQIYLEMQRRQHHRAADRKLLNAEKRRLEFAERVVKFTDSYNALMENGRKGVWNPKQAKAARKAFERLVHSEAWLETSK
jgi:hypothetical protein